MMGLGKLEAHGEEGPGGRTGQPFDPVAERERLRASRRRAEELAAAGDPITGLESLLASLVQALRGAEERRPGARFTADRWREAVETYRREHPLR